MEGEQIDLDKKHDLWDRLVLRKREQAQKYIC